MTRRYTGGFLSAKEQATDANTANGIFSVQDAAALTAAGSFPTGNWTPQRSLRFRRSAGAYLTRTPSVASGQNQWTLSTWVKRGVLGDSASQIIGGNTTTSGGVRNMLSVEFGSDNALWVYAFTNASGYYFQRTSKQLFRDPSAWYHLVVQFDPDNATSDNKVIAFVNGQRLTWSTASDSGAAGNIGSSSYRAINNTFRNDINGGYQGGGVPIYFGDQYLSEMYMVSGSLVAPSSFIQTDSETGALVPKQYTGTYGTNGFYLDFRDNTSSTNLALDRSGNSNNWTPNNITVSGVTSTTLSFTSVGTTTWTPPANVTSVNYLVVAGGGAGGSAGPTMYDGGAAGGGAGGMLTGTMAVTPGTVYSIYVGAGGTGAANRTRGASGDNSVFSSSSTSIIAIGGGGGGGGANTTSGANGGSGGGGANGGAAGTGTAGQGNNGGFYVGSPGNGGGGRGSVGGSASSNVGAAGGTGATSDISGSTVTYSAGGGGGGYQLGGGAGGSSGVGGAGGSNNSNGSNASASTGSGGGGSGGTYNTTGTLTGGSGANGIIILSYSVPDSTYDSSVDVPGIASTSSQTDFGGVTRGNYPVLSPISVYNGGGTLSNGNLSVSFGDTANNKPTMGAISGKWYTEITCTSSGGYSGTGLSVAVTSTSYENAFINAWYYSNGQTYNYATDSYVSYGATWGTGDFIGVAWDCDNGNVTFYKNGVSQGLLTAVSGVRIVPESTVGSAPYPTAYGTGVTSTFTVNYGQRPFRYAPPNGFKSLCSTNLPNPVIKRPTDHFDVKTWTGNGSNILIGTTQKQTSAYAINKSLRFRKANSAYLSRTPSATGNQKTWTWSGWVKQSSFGSNGTQWIITSGNSGSITTNYTSLSFSANGFLGNANQLQFFSTLSNSTVLAFESSQRFGDPVEWCNVVLAVDTTQVNSVNRVKLYVDGVQITSFATATYPSLNADIPFINGSSFETRIGGIVSYGSFDGYMTEVNFVDGQALTPSSFGAFDANNNWVPQRYTGTFGTQGYYLPFNHNTTSSFAAIFNGSNQYLTVPDNSVWAFSGNWTVEAFFYVTNTTNALQTIVAQWVDGGGGDRAFTIGVDSSARLTAYAQYGANQYNPVSSSGTIKTGQWYHTALVANGSTLTLYLNGVPISSVSITGTINNSTAPVGIGAYANSSWPLSGGVSNVRITNTAVYTSKFIPPTAALTAISGTQLLTLQNATLVDNSTNNFTITNVNSATISSVTPFIMPILASDQSGNINNWFPVGFSEGTANDSMFDSPTDTVDSNGNVIGNYGTLNPLYKGSLQTISNANLTSSKSSGTNISDVWGNFGMTSGKWYFECSVAAVAATVYIGIGQGGGTGEALDDLAVSSTSYFYGNTTGDKFYGGSIQIAYGNTYTAGNIIGCAVDMDNGKIWWSKDGTWQASGNPAAGTNAAFTDLLTRGSNPFFAFSSTNGASNSNTLNWNFGQQPFAYTPPTGFRSLNSKNLKDIGSYNLPDNFGNYVNTPDLVWIKNRSTTNNHILQDTVRGVSSYLDLTNDSNQSATNAVQAFLPNGFQLGSISGGNSSGNNAVAWTWNRGKTPGFDIVTYAGNGTNGRLIPHNLGQVPAMYFTKCLTSYNDSNGFADWNVWHKSVDVSSYGGSKTLYLMNDIAAGAAGGYFANPTSSEFSPNQTAYDNVSGHSYLAYLWAEVPGFSKFGLYTGNNSLDGPFVYTGFKPAFILIKRRDGTSDWFLLDNKRGTFNPIGAGNGGMLSTNQTYAESTLSTYAILDIVSNGFKIRSDMTYGYLNVSGGNYIYAAFAENPFKYSNAR